MEVIRIPRIMQDTCRKHILKGKSVGFVPTMGALHNGHMSLIKRSRMDNDITAASIFVNPLQFGPAEDLNRYPRDVEGDMAQLREKEVDILFLPDGAAMYPPGFSTHIDVGGVYEKLCGAFRPGHFRGVATVVVKLFNLVCPTRAYFGQKDYQQTVVIRRICRDLNLPIEIVVCPTVREEDGLAMSSRNRYLGSSERAAAALLFRSLSEGASAIKAGAISCAKVKETMRGILGQAPLISEIEYASVYDPETLDEVGEIHGETLLAVAVRIGGTRLIDNMLVTV